MTLIEKIGTNLIMEPKFFLEEDPGVLEFSPKA
jgi:hypothetical protein